MSSKVLRNFNLALQHVKFDPTNKEHLEAASLILKGVPNPKSVVGTLSVRQHPTIRFMVDESHNSVPEMLVHSLMDEAMKKASNKSRTTTAPKVSKTTKSSSRKLALHAV